LSCQGEWQAEDASALLSGPDGRRDPDAERTIAEPDPERPPLKANVYWFVQTAMTTLAPLFPWFDDGGDIFRGQNRATSGSLIPRSSVRALSTPMRTPALALICGALHPLIYGFHEAADTPEERAARLAG
jgi:hypothetical protein